MKSANTANQWTRRNFLGALAASGATVSLTPAAFTKAERPVQEKYSIHVFSKHLQFLDYEAMAETAAEIGFDGVDLTVRPGGHILPGNVERNLPKAVEAIKKNGLDALMMTTAVINAEDAVQKRVLKTASEVGIRYYRTNWLSYGKDVEIARAMEQYQQQLKTLADLNRQLNIYGSYQNHSGSHYVGAPVWDLAMMLREIDNEHMGSQYDIRHATVEGGFSWPLGLNLIRPHINTIVIKDFRWEEKGGDWKVKNTPIGEGMVDFSTYFDYLKSYNIKVPVSVHYEYEMPENDPSLNEREKRKKTMEVMKKDLETLKSYMAKAGLI